METVDRFSADIFARMEELGVLYRYDTIGTLLASTTSLIEALPAVKVLCLMLMQAPLRIAMNNFSHPGSTPLSHSTILRMSVFSLARSVSRVHDHVPRIPN